MENLQFFYIVLCVVQTSLAILAITALHSFIRSLALISIYTCYYVKSHPLYLRAVMVVFYSPSLMTVIQCIAYAGLMHKCGGQKRAFHLFLCFSVFIPILAVANKLWIKPFA